MTFALIIYALVGFLALAMFHVGGRADTLKNTGDDLPNCGWFKTPIEDDFPAHNREL